MQVGKLVGILSNSKSFSYVEAGKKGVWVKLGVREGNNPEKS